MKCQLKDFSAGGGGTIACSHNFSSIFSDQEVVFFKAKEQILVLSLLSLFLVAMTFITFRLALQTSNPAGFMLSVLSHLVHVS